MATRRPIVRIDGRLKELPVGDTLPGGGGASPLHIGTSAPPDPDATPFWWDETAGVFVVHIGGGVYIEPGANFIPSGGMPGQLPAKASGSDFDLAWIDPPATQPREIFVQSTQPADTGVPYLWIQTGLPNGGHTIWFNDDGTT